MAKNDIPGMKGNATPANPYEGMWGPVGGGNAFPYGGNPMPWLGGGQGPQQGGGGSIFNQILAKQRQGMQGPGIGQQNPNAAFNRPEMPGQGQPPFMGLKPPMGGGINSPNPNENSVGNMAAAASLGPSQNQGLLEAIMKMGQMGPIGGGMQEYQPMAGGNIPPDASSLMNKIGQAGMGIGNMMRPAVEPGRQELAGYGAPPAPSQEQPSPAQSSVAPSGSFFSRFRQPRNG